MLPPPSSFGVCLIVLALLLGLTAGGAAGAAPARPNLLLIVADDLGFGDLACFGARDMRTPHLDALAASGMRMERFYANSPVCSPTRAALLTGRYPDLVGVPGVIRTHPENNWGYLSPGAELLPKPLKRGGYTAALIGKWHLGLEPPNTPSARGFDFFHGFLGDMMDDYSTHRRHGINYMRRNGEEIDPEGHATDLFTRWASDYLRLRTTRRPASKRPFFLYLAYNAPHTPIQPPEEWVRRVQAREPGIPESRARLVALIEHMDGGIGQVLDALRETGDLANTLVVFTSDNGGQLNVGASNGPLRGGKEDVYEGGIRVPLIASWPGRIPAGGHSQAIGLTMDLFPTLCEAGGVKPPPGLDGVSLLPALAGKPAPPPERTLVWVRREGGNRYQGKSIHALRRGVWKLVHNSPFEPVQLFNLADDPMETRDRARSDPQVFSELSAALRDHIRRAGQVPWQRPE